MIAIIKMRYANAKQSLSACFGDEDRQWTFAFADALAVVAILPGFYGALPRTWRGHRIWRPYPDA